MTVNISHLPEDQRNYLNTLESSYLTLAQNLNMLNYFVAQINSKNYSLIMPILFPESEANSFLTKVFRAFPLEDRAPDNIDHIKSAIKTECFKMINMFFTDHRPDIKIYMPDFYKYLGEYFEYYADKGIIDVRHDLDPAFREKIMELKAEYTGEQLKFSKDSIDQFGDWMVEHITLDFTEYSAAFNY